MAKRKRKALTPYQREVSNLKRRIASAKKRGWMFDEVKIPRTAKAVKALRGEALWSKAYGFTDQSFGEFYTAQDVVKSLKAEAARRRQTTRKHPKRKPEQPVANRGQISLNELETWLSNFTPDLPTPTGVRRRNPRWERVMQARYDAYNQIKETYEGIKDALANQWYDADVSMPMEEWVGNRLADRLESAPGTMSDLTSTVQFDSNEDKIWNAAHAILAALHGAPMDIYTRKSLGTSYDLSDPTDYTDEDEFPV